jgi:hypothetical protein
MAPWTIMISLFKSEAEGGSFEIRKIMDHFFGFIPSRFSLSDSMPSGIEF